MDQSLNNCVLIVAAGRGERMKETGVQEPKQYIRLDSHTILHHCINSFATMNKIDAILIVIHPDDKQLYQASIPKNCDKLLPPVYGAETRQASVLNGLVELSKYNPQKVLIHDAARPFIDHATIDKTLNTLETHKAALVAIPLSDTLKKANDRNTVKLTIPRSGLWRAQTPQAFQFADIYSAHKLVIEKAKDIDFTDDASIAEWANIDVQLIQGSETNRKITLPEDLDWARNILELKRMQYQKSIRMGSGFDVHAFEEGDNVILCGINIPHNKSLKGHSDADVAMHALTDALFGAMSDGDIGTHFPPSDTQWKGAASDQFLRYAVERLRERSGMIQNVDITIICEKPKISPHSYVMRENLSNIMDLPIDRISVKATTTEKLGFTGRSEGIASMATATISLP